MLEAPFGMGKSLTVRDLAIDLAAAWLLAPEAEPMPLLLEAPRLLRGHAQNLRAAVLGHLEEALGLGRDAAEWIWRHGRVVLLLDSFDEVVQDRTAARKWVDELAQAATNGRRALLASRDYGYDRGWLEAGCAVVALQPLSDDQAQRWLDRHCALLGRDRLQLVDVLERLGDLSYTPILLLMAVWTWDTDDVDIPGRAGLYARFIARTSQGKWADLQGPHPQVREGARHLGPQAFEEALARVAWAHLLALGRRGEGLAVRRVHDTLRGWLPELEGRHLEEVQQAVVLSLFFRRGEGDELRFGHRSFREFLCARYLELQLEADLRDPSRRGFLLAIAEGSAAQEELRFLRGLLARRPELLELALREVDGAYERGEQVVFLDREKAESWGDSKNIVRFRAPIRLPQLADAVGGVLRGHERSGGGTTHVGHWRLSDDLASASHAADGRLALVTNEREPRLVGRPDFIERERDLVFYGLHEMRLDTYGIRPRLPWRAEFPERVRLVRAIGADLRDTSYEGELRAVGVGPGGHLVLLGGRGDPVTSWARYALETLQAPALIPELAALRRILALCGYAEAPFGWDELLGAVTAVLSRWPEASAGPP